MSVFGYIRIMPSLDDVTKDIVEDYKKHLLDAASEHKDNAQDSDQKLLNKNTEQPTLSEKASDK